MRSTLQYLFLSGVAFLLPSLLLPSFAQERCGTVEYSKNLHPNYPIHRAEFEEWMTRKNLRRQTGQGRAMQSAPYKIPVVVHVIHNGETIGTGVNISDEQIMSQIAVLNEDFTRANGDATSTPAEFVSVAGDLDIEFVLAKQDPDGLPTDGIVRVDGGKDLWTINDNYTLKGLSYWPAEQYMNIWVCNLVDYIGYAQQPESDLDGLGNSSTNRLTDGIVIWHRAFGSMDDGPFDLDPAFNKGRTVTHETGHFLGLFHIWGDDVGCNGTDYVADTPNQGNRSQGCPTHPRTDACGEVVMFQNFLDYTDDECMNLFTQGQMDRMSIVIENSPRRSTLLTSPGLEEPDPLPNDVGIRTIVSPGASVCSNDVTPIVELRNYGNNTVTSARIRFTLDGTTKETRDFALSVSPGETVQVSFTPVPIPSGSHEVSFLVLETNGGSDSGPHNDEKVSPVIIPYFGDIPFIENMNAPPLGWITQNPDGQVTWEIVTAPNESPTNRALKLDYFSYEDKIGEIDMVVSPVIDLSTAPAATLNFDVAHARYQSSNDRLQVVVLTNCEGISSGTVVYDKAGSTLQTAPARSSPFVPSNETHWRREFVDLRDFIGFEKVQLAFLGINDWGNNIYVDNIRFFTEPTLDAALVRINSPAVVTCENVAEPRLLIRNAGNLPLNSITVEYSVNGGQPQSVNLSGLDLQKSGSEKEVTLPTITFADGENTFTVELVNPNGTADDNPTDNVSVFTVVVNDHRDRIPLRENFDGDFAAAWTLINPSGGMNWQTIATNFGQSVYFNGFENDAMGDEAWLASPVLDFSVANQASMQFDLSYRQRPGVQDNLTILASTDCGVTYKEIPYTFPQPDVSLESWIPSDADDWNRNVTVNLNSLRGEENVRLAFVVRNQNGNNLYLDNIEFFVTSNPDVVDVPGLYSIYGYDLENPSLNDLKISFNLPERQTVRFSIVSLTGQMETDGVISNVLNQTYSLDISDRLAAGVYVIRLEIGGKYYSSKLVVF